MTQRRKRYDRQFKVSAAKVVLSGEMTVKGLSEELGIKDSTLRRWAREYEEMGDGAFPGNGSPKINKDYEIVKLKKKVEELERENEILKKFPGLLESRPCVRFEFLSYRSIEGKRVRVKVVWSSCWLDASRCSPQVRPAPIGKGCRRCIW